MARDMSRLYYGSFEAILRSHIRPQISQAALGDILLTSPYVDGRKGDKTDLRSDERISKTLISRLCTGKRPLPKEIYDQHHAPEAIEYIKLCFDGDIIPQIRKGDETTLLQKILSLIQNDNRIPDERKEYFIKLSQEETLGDFLAEVYQYSVDPELRKHSLPNHSPNDKENLRQEKADVFFPPVEEIFPTAKDIILTPGEIIELKVAIIPKEAANAPLNYVSLDTSIVTVSTTGMLLAHDGRTTIGQVNKTADVIIQSESGISVSKTVVVEFTDEDRAEPIVSDINDFKASYSVKLNARLLNDIEWKDYLEAKVGDKVEFRIQYTNISKNEYHKNVMLKDALPTNVKLVSGTTTLYNANHPSGTVYTSDAIIDNGINIGHYYPESNGIVTFTAEIIDKNLQCGSNTLINWVQAGVNRVGLQDYAVITTIK